MLSECTIYNHLKRLGVPANLKGYNALMQAILLVDSNPYQVKVTKEVYAEIARATNSTAFKVERCIRNAIERTFERSDPEILQEYFGSTPDMRKGKLTNTEFIYGMLEYIKYCDTDKS